MSITINLSEAVETITATIVDGEETITATINELPRGVAGPAGPNSVTVATSSDGTADLDVATITGDGSGLTGLVSSQITDKSADGAATDAGKVVAYATGGALVTSGVNASISTLGDDAPIFTQGVNAYIAANQSYIQAFEFKIAAGASEVLTLSSSPTALRSIAFPDADGTVALTTSNVATATALQTARNIFGISFNGTANVSGDATNAGHFASIPTGGAAGHFITLNGTAPTVIAGRSAWWSDGSGVPSFRNGTGSAVTLVRSSDLGTGVATALAATTNAAGGFVTANGTATLSNKTLTTPTIAQINGGTAANDDLTLQGTTNATRTTSYVLIQPNGGLTQVGAGTPVTDTALPLQLSTAGSGTETNIGINKNGAYGFLLGFKNGTGTSFANYLGGYMRNVTTDPFSIIVNNTQIATTWTSNGSVGLGGTITHTGTLAGAHLIIDGTTGRATFNGPAKLRGYTFATLPTGSIGDKAYITDGAASPTFRANAAGGGSTVTEVFFNGTAWINS